MEVRAAGIVIFRKVKKNYEYLFLQAAYGSHHWTPPKGHVDPGESDLDAALRETKEEAGILEEEIKIMKNFQRTLMYTVQDVPKTVVYFLGELLVNKPIKLSAEHRDYKWGNLKASMNLAVYKDTQKLLEECENYLKQNYSVTKV